MVGLVCSSSLLRRAVAVAAVLLCAVPAFARTNYVDIACTNSFSPFLDWSTAATNIQDAVDVALDGDTVLVSNGVYEAAGRPAPGCSLTNRVVVTNNIMVKSVNGAPVTIIKGRQPRGPGAVRCVFITNGVLDGFTLTNGATGGGSQIDADGGCAYAANGTLNNCILVNGVATNGGVVAWGTLNNCKISSGSAGTGGGASFCKLNNCLLFGNTGIDAGGAYRCSLYNCTVANNKALGAGGGTWGGTLYNSIVIYNTAPLSNNLYGSSASYSCSTPIPEGDGNIGSPWDIHL